MTTWSKRGSRERGGLRGFRASPGKVLFPLPAAARTLLSSLLIDVTTCTDPNLKIDASYRFSRIFSGFLLTARFLIG